MQEVLRDWWRILLYGLILWFFIFLISFVIIPIKKTNLAFFETLMTLWLTLCAEVVASFYFRKKNITLPLGFGAGFIWMLLCGSIGLVLFKLTTPKENLWIYFTDEGFTYLVIPIITTGLAWILSKNKANPPAKI